MFTWLQDLKVGVKPSYGLHLLPVPTHPACLYLPQAVCTHQQRPSLSLFFLRRVAGPPALFMPHCLRGGPWGSPRQAWPAGWFWWWTGCGEVTLLGSGCSGRMKSGSQSSPQGWSEPSPPQPWTRSLWGSSPFAVLSAGCLGSWSTVPAAIPGCWVKQRSMAGVGGGWGLVTSLAHGQEF